MGGHRGTVPDRAGAARRDLAQRQRHGHPGGGGPAHPRPPGRGDAGALAGHRDGRAGGTRRAAQAARCLRRPDDEAALAPVPGLARVGVLVEQMREAGLPTELRIEGAPDGIAPGVDLTAYRIIQEALTNTLRHAGPARAQVSIRYRPHELDLRISDDGHRSPGTVRAGPPMPTAPGMACLECANASRCTAGHWRPVTATPASPCTPGCPPQGRRRHDPGHHRR